MKTKPNTTYKVKEVLHTSTIKNHNKRTLTQTITYRTLDGRITNKTIVHTLND